MMSSYHNVVLLFSSLFVGCCGVSRGNRTPITCFSEVPHRNNEARLLQPKTTIRRKENLQLFSKSKSRNSHRERSTSSFFGEFLKDGSFVMVEPLREVQCAEKSTHCFLEIYRLDAQTWFNGQCDDSFACRYEAEYLMPHGCQATLHGGDRCCCSQNNCNFERILVERPDFKRFLPKSESEKEFLPPNASTCGKKPTKHG